MLSSKHTYWPMRERACTILIVLYDDVEDADYDDDDEDIQNTPLTSYTLFQNGGQ